MSRKNIQNQRIPTNQENLNTAIAKTLFQNDWLRKEDIVPKQHFSEEIDCILKDIGWNPDVGFETSKNVFIIEVDERVKEKGHNSTGASPHTFRAHSLLAAYVQGESKKKVHLIEIISHPSAEKYMQRTRKGMNVFKKECIFLHKSILYPLPSVKEILQDLLSYISSYEKNSHIS